jgi:hypothetical protein
VGEAVALGETSEGIIHGSRGDRIRKNWPLKGLFLRAE